MKEIIFAYWSATTITCAGVGIVDDNCLDIVVLCGSVVVVVVVEVMDG